MKIALLSGASKNAGDFLIVQRCKELLMHFLDPEAITEFDRSHSLESHIDEINKNDLLVFGGGPAYVASMYPKKLPLVENLNDIKIPFFAMAMGWKGNSDLFDTVQNYDFNAKTKELLNRFEKDGYSFGCRDYFSQHILDRAGYSNNIMTGCAAWYDIRYVGNNELRNRREIKKVFISDPADPKNFGQFIEVVKRCKTIFPSAEIKIVFHRGINSDTHTTVSDGKALQALIGEIKRLKLEYVDIAYSSNGFELYNECDLHIGYRVHAHIYNLSQRQRTILIEEDGRGAGVDQAVGLKQIRSYAYRKISYNKYERKIKQKLGIYKTQSETVCEELAQYVRELEQNNYKQFEWAFERMQYYFDNMEKHLKQVAKGVK